MRAESLQEKDRCLEVISQVREKEAARLKAAEAKLFIVAETKRRVGEAEPKRLASEVDANRLEAEAEANKQAEALDLSKVLMN